MANLHVIIQENSPRAKLIELLAVQSGSTPEEMAQSLLDEAIDARLKKAPASQMWGACAEPAEATLLDEIVAEAYEIRKSSGR
jgi:hypothetical protein